MKETMTYKGYIGSVHISEESECLYGKIEAINDLIAFEANDVTGLKKAFHEAVDDYLIFCEEVGKEPQKSFKGSFNVRVGPEIHQRVAFIAARRGETLNHLVQEALIAHCKLNRPTAVKEAIGILMNAPKDRKHRIQHTGTLIRSAGRKSTKAMARGKTKTVAAKSGKKIAMGKK
jgi:predicted HicB family RNase H-like nuclease